jgi:hypothetical protein
MFGISPDEIYLFPSLSGLVTTDRKQDQDDPAYGRMH